MTRAQWHALVDLCQQAQGELRDKDRVAFGVVDAAREVGVRMLGCNPYKKVGT